MKWTILTLLLISINATADDVTATDSNTATASDTLSAVATSTSSSTASDSSTGTATKTDTAMSIKDRVALYNSLLSEAPNPPAFEMPDASALLWEDKDYPERLAWSKFTFRTINPVLDDLNQAKDIDKFCPNYHKITRNQQILVWSEIFASVAYWESSFDPLNSTKELFEDKGTDNVTHLPVYSCGLLQLSYQDTITYRSQGFCHFDWEKDRKLDAHDIHRTIFNPFTNLYCGINIMATNVRKIGKIVSHDHYYWSTLQSGNFLEDRHGQIERMIHNELPFCGGNKFFDFVLDHTVDPGLEFIRDHIDPENDQSSGQ